MCLNSSLLLRNICMVRFSCAVTRSHDSGSAPFVMHPCCRAGYCLEKMAAANIFTPRLPRDSSRYIMIHLFGRHPAWNLSGLTPRVWKPLTVCYIICLEEEKKEKWSPFFFFLSLHEYLRMHVFQNQCIHSRFLCGERIETAKDKRAVWTEPCANTVEKRGFGRWFSQVMKTSFLLHGWLLLLNAYLCWFNEMCLCTGRCWNAHILYMKICSQPHSYISRRDVLE